MVSTVELLPRKTTRIPIMRAANPESADILLTKLAMITDRFQLHQSLLLMKLFISV